MFLTAMSFFPILFLIYLMTKKHAMPSHQALPLVSFITYLAMLLFYQFEPVEIHANVIAGFLTAFTPIMIIWGAIFLFRAMEASGAMGVLRQWLNSVTSNPTAQLMIVGWAFAFLIEGASGFGTPAALAAPVLVGLGFKPLPVAIMVLTMNTIPVSFGAVGTPTWFGFSAIDLSNQQIAKIGIKTAVIQGVASLVIPVLALRFVVSWREIRKNIIFIYISIVCTMIPYVLVAFWNYEFPALVGGASGLILSVIAASKGWGLPSVKEGKAFTRIPGKKLIKAGFPLWGTLGLLVVTRIPQLGIKPLLNATEPAVSVSLKGVGVFSLSSSLVLMFENILGTTESWAHKLLYVPSIIPFIFIALITFFLYKSNGSTVRGVFRSSLFQMKAPTLALFGALIFVKLMMMGGEDAAVHRIGIALAHMTGGAWYGFAALLGAVGSFFSGSNTISNLTFGPIQYTIAKNLDLNLTTVLALQSVGGAMGNMICINNIVAVCSVLAIPNREGFILLRTARVLIPYALISAGVAIFFFR